MHKQYRLDDEEQTSKTREQRASVVHGRPYATSDERKSTRAVSIESDANATTLAVLPDELPSLNIQGVNNDAEALRLSGALSPYMHSDSSILADPPSGGHIVGDYELSQVLGEGGMGVVYKARHLKLNNTVALKMLHPEIAADAIGLKRFNIEVKAASMLTHPNLIAIYESGVSSQGQPYLVMDYLDGKGLDQLISEQGFLELPQFYVVFRQVCDALEHAHSKGVIHRDVKPGNIMIVHNDSGLDYVKVLDFGIARVLQQATVESRTATQSQTIVGSPAYMSPEQCLGQPLDVRSDIYSLGALMYEALTGRPPFAGENPIQVIVQQVRDEVTSPLKLRPDMAIPPELDRLVMRMLEKDPDKRFQTVREVLLQLDCLAEGRPVPSSAAGSLRQPIRREPFFTTVHGQVLLASLFATVAAYCVLRFPFAPLAVPVVDMTPRPAADVIVPPPAFAQRRVSVPFPPAHHSYLEESKVSRPAWAEVERLLKLGDTALVNQDWEDAVTLYKKADQIAALLKVGVEKRLYVYSYAARALIAEHQMNLSESRRDAMNGHLAREATRSFFVPALDLYEKTRDYRGWINLLEQIEGTGGCVDAFNHAEYVRLQEKELELLQREHFPSHKILWASDSLGQYYESSGMPEKAESAWIVGIKTMRKSPVSTLPGPPDRLADLYKRQGRLKEEAAMRRFALDANYAGFVDGSYTLSMVEPEFKALEASLRRLGREAQANAVAARWQGLQKHGKS